MKPRIFFVDVKCKQAYTFASLSQQAVGGTESVMLRIAKGLSDDYDVSIVQPERDESFSDEHGLRYLTLVDAEASAGQQPIQHLIVLRKIKAMKDMVRRLPAKHNYLWIHDLPVAKYARYRKDLTDTHTTLICVSRYQQQLAQQYLQPAWWQRRLGQPGELPMTVIGNVINPEIQYQPRQVDENKLVFFSAPRKGLKQVLAQFERLLPHRPEARLYIANPGYEDMDEHWANHPNIVNLGRLSNTEVVEHVRQAFCVFYPQQVLPETYGVIYAEANSVGTPVLGFDIGAAREVLDKPDEQLLALDADPIERLLGWYANGAPQVEARDMYQLETQLRSWRSLLDNSAS